MSQPEFSETINPDTEIPAREKEIRGNAPRIDPLPPDQYDEAAKKVVDEIGLAVGIPPPEKLTEFFATLMKHPQLMQRQFELSIQLFKGALTARDRELAILRVAWLSQAPYEWGEHVNVSKREAGLTSEEIERVTVGSGAPQWNEHERSLLRAVEEMLSHAVISDETWTALARTMDEKQLLELPILVGMYQGVAYQQNSVRFRLSAHNQGLSAR